MKSLNKSLVIGFLLYPLWGWLLMTYLGVIVDYVFGILSIGYALVLLVHKLYAYERVRFPAYIFFLFLFYVYTLFINSATGALDVGTKGLLIYLLVNEHFIPIFLFFIIENLDIDLSFFKTIKPLALALFIVSVIVSVIQYYIPFFWMNMSFVNFADYLDFTQRLWSIYTWVSSNAVGISFPFLVAYLYVNYRNDFIRFSIAMGSLLFAFLSQTRVVIISIVVILLYLYLKSGKIKFSKILLLLIIPVFSYLILSFFSFDFDRFIDQRVLETEGSQYDMSSAGDRVVSYKAFFKIFPDDNPVFGNGEKVTPHLREFLGPDLPFIHIGYLHYLYAYGICGCLLFFTFCGLLMKRVYTMSKSLKDYSFFIGLICLFINNTVMVWFRFFDFGLFICYLSLITKYYHAFGPMFTPRYNSRFAESHYNA